MKNNEIYIVKGSLVGILDYACQDVLAVYDDEKTAREFVKNELEKYLKDYKEERWDGHSKITVHDKNIEDMYFTDNGDSVVVEAWLIPAFVNIPDKSLKHFL